jgi:chemotaxis protein MotB
MPDDQIAGRIRASSEEERSFQIGQTESEDFKEEGAPLWTTTFGDLMSLLLTFFVLMYSMSELKIERFAQAKASLSEAFGGVAALPPPDPTGTVPDPALPLPNPGASAGESDTIMDEGQLFAITDAYLAQIARQLQEFIDENGLQETLSVIRGDDGVRLRILSTTLFPSGSALLNEDKSWILNILGAVTASLDVPAVVSGHTDDLPIQTSAFFSNWELSAARAAGVARELVANGHDPESLRVEAFGEHQPVASNSTEEGRAQNRRVEILFSRDDILSSAQRWMDEGRDIEEMGDR